MLNTNLKHLETAEEIKQVIAGNNMAMLCCGRMGPMCIPVYRAMERLEDRYPQVVFRDVDFDTEAADVIKTLPQCTSFMQLPFVVYTKKGAVAAAVSGIQSEEEIVAALDTYGT